MLRLALALSAAAAAICTAEDGWNAAYVTGDTGFLDRLLADDYISVGGTGKDHDKAAILASARTYAAAHPGTAPRPMPSN